jgi:hypothetical protein
MEEEVKSWLQQYANNPIDYAGAVEGITSSANWIGFLTVFKGNVVSLVHSLGQFRTGLGPTSPGNDRTFGLLGERVGTGAAPIIMVPSTGGLTAWIRPIAVHEPTDDSTDRIIEKPTIQGDETKDEDPAHPMVEVTTLCFIPKAWAAHFLDQCSPYEAFGCYKKLIATVPAGLRDKFHYMEAWMRAACIESAPHQEDYMLTAKWQASVKDRKVNTWMERHTQYVNAVPSQMCFDKAMDTIATLKPSSETKKNSIAELQHLRATCSLTVAEMATNLPELYQSLLMEGQSKRGTEAIMANALRPMANNDDPGLIYLSPELVADVRNCKCGLGWGTSYRNCHRVSLHSPSPTCPSNTSRRGRSFKTASA